MKNFRRINNILGWVVFAISALVYLLTMEPTVSLWDCGEFISSAFKLQVGHPPGAPLFMILARTFSLFAGTHHDKVALMVNASSALASALTVMFLYWTIVHLAMKLVQNRVSLLSFQDHFIVIGSGIVGALAYTFTDSFWFSAVEGEVYASSSLFTAVVFWAMLKWENEADEKYSNRWLILIAYLMGLSIGVHLVEPSCDTGNRNDLLFPQIQGYHPGCDCGLHHFPAAACIHHVYCYTRCCLVCQPF